MIHQDFPEPNTPEWVQWRQDAETAIRKLIDQVQAGQSPRINDQLYKRQRQMLFDAFHGKCAYCEARFVLDQSGDVEHFRPKGAVLDKDGQPVLVSSAPGSNVPHPGYYWLAYDWHNLLPSCGKCNRMTRTRDGKWVGKGARFPVKSSWAWHPGEEATEDPLLIHPVLDEPEKYLGIDVNTGVIYAVDDHERGKTCIDVFDLNREGLPETRRRVYTQLLTRIQAALMAAFFRQWDVFQENFDAILDFQTGKEEYSLAGKKALEGQNDLRQALKRIEDLLGGAGG